MSPTKNTATLTPAQRKRTTLADRAQDGAEARIERETEAKVAGNRAARRSSKAPVKVEPVSNISLLIVDTATRDLGEKQVATLLADLGHGEVKLAKLADSLADEMFRLRRMHLATPARLELLGPDTPDLAGDSEAYKSAIGRVNDEARAIIARRLVAGGMPRADAADLAAKKVETVRQSASVAVRKLIDAEFVGQPLALLQHGFNYRSNIGKAQVLISGAKLADDMKSVVCPAGFKLGADGKFVVDTKTTAGNQLGQGKEAETLKKAVESATAALASAMEKGDRIALLERATAILTTILSMPPVEDTETLADRATTFVTLERAAVRVMKHLGITDDAHKAAIARTSGKSPAQVATTVTSGK